VRGCVVSGNFAVQRDLGDVQVSVSNRQALSRRGQNRAYDRSMLTDLPNGVLSSAERLENAEQDCRDSADGMRRPELPPVS
jgi:hypothetical protein